MGVGPVHAHRRPVRQYENDGLAGRVELFQQLLLGCGQVQAGAIAAGEAGRLDDHFLALEL